MTDATPSRRIEKYFVAQALGSAGFFVMASYKHEPDYWRKLAWFPSQDRAESYVEIENDMNDGDLGPREEEFQEKPSLPEPPTAVTLENFRPAPIAIEPPPAPPPPTPQRVTMTEEVVERREYRSVSRPAPDEDAAKAGLSAAQGSVLKAFMRFLPAGDGYVSFKDLATFSGVPTGSVSFQIDELERKGFVERIGAKGDPSYRVLRRLVSSGVEIEDDPPPDPPTPPAAAVRQVARRLDGEGGIVVPSRERLMGGR